MCDCVLLPIISLPKKIWGDEKIITTRIVLIFTNFVFFLYIKD